MTDTLPMFSTDGRPDPGLLGTLTGRDHPSTSRAAALIAFPRSGTKRWQILNRLREVYPAGLTDEELQEQLPMSPNTERPRRVELVAGGWVGDSGERVPSSTGSPSSMASGDSLSTGSSDAYPSYRRDRTGTTVHKTGCSRIGKDSYAWNYADYYDAPMIAATIKRAGWLRACKVCKPDVAS